MGLFVLVNDDNREFVENEIRIAELNIEKDRSTLKNVFLIGVGAVAAFSIGALFTLGPWMALIILVVLSVLLWRFLSSMTKLNQERLVSHKREIEMRKRQLQSMGRA